MTEDFWHEARRVATTRYYVVDAATGQITRYASNMQAYIDEEYHTLLAVHGFTEMRRYASLGGDQGQVRDDLLALVARKPDDDA